MELVYKRAGHLELFRYRDSKRFLYNGIVQSIAASITNNTVDLEDGNSDWPWTFSTGKTGSNVTFNLNSFNPMLYAALTASEYAEENDLAIRRIEEISVPSESPYTVTLKKAPEADTLVLVNEDNSPFVESTSPPSTGKYSLASSTLTFAKEDAGISLVAAYDYKASKAGHMEMAEQTNNDVFRVTVAGEATRKDNEGIVIPDSLTFDRMIASGELAWPTRQREPQGWNFTMTIQKPRPGHKAVDYRVENVSA